MMSEPTNKLRLRDTFPPVSTREWEKKIASELSGIGSREKLRWHTSEGVDPLPFYRREDREKLNLSPASDGDNHGWEIRSTVWGPTVREANKHARNALDNGADALFITVDPAPGESGNPFVCQGVQLQARSDFTQLFESIPLNQTPVHFDSGLLSPALLGMAWQETADSGELARSLRGSMLYDPFADQLCHGILYPRSKLLALIHQYVSFCRDKMPGVRPLAIDARIYHNSGGSIVQELAFALGVAAEYLAMLTDRDYSAGEIAGMLHFNVAAGSRYFLEMAKFRALRLLWDNLIHAFGGNPEQSPAYIHAETSRRNKTRYDPYTNMLRTSTEGMASTLAGCDALTVRPFDATFRQPDSFSRRIARNAQIIMREEAYLHKVQDPAAGSYYIEQLTHDTARRAWQLFQKVEGYGGMAKAIEEGFVQSSITSSRQRREQALAERDRILVGINQYANPDEKWVNELNQTAPAPNPENSDPNQQHRKFSSIKKLSALLAGGTELGDVIPLLFRESAQKVDRLHPFSGSGAFEELRLATERHPSTPKVLNLPVGDRRMRKTRSSFSSNFFGCLGYDIVEPVGFEQLSEALASIDREQPDIVVLCSSDGEYRELVPALCKHVRGETDRPLLVLSGRPEEDIPSYKEEGIDIVIHSGCNVLQTLKDVQLQLGIIEH